MMEIVFRNVNWYRSGKRIFHVTMMDPAVNDSRFFLFAVFCDFLKNKKF